MMERDDVITVHALLAKLHVYRLVRRIQLEEESRYNVRRGYNTAKVRLVLYYLRTLKSDYRTRFLPTV